MLKKLILGLMLISMPSLVSALTFIGYLNVSECHPESVNNHYGRYGNRHSFLSINNRHGRYGCPCSDYSANNPYATRPPLLFDQYGNYMGELRADQYDCQFSVSFSFGTFGNRFDVCCPRSYCWPQVISIYGQ